MIYPFYELTEKCKKSQNINAQTQTHKTQKIDTVCNCHIAAPKLTRALDTDELPFRASLT
jgi:hypothetical protein